jgi:hypothetical protein
MTHFLNLSLQVIVFKQLSESARKVLFSKVSKKVLGAYKKIWLHQKNFDGSKNL